MEDIPTISVLFIDRSTNHRTYWAEQLKRCSPSYEILEASDAQSGLDLYRSRRVDCVVLEIALQDESGFVALLSLVPLASKPQVAVGCAHPVDASRYMGVSQAARGICVLGKEIHVGRGLG